MLEFFPATPTLWSLGDLSVATVILFHAVILGRLLREQLSKQPNLLTCSKSKVIWTHAQLFRQPGCGEWAPATMFSVPNRFSTTMYFNTGLQTKLHFLQQDKTNVFFIQASPVGPKVW